MRKGAEIHHLDLEGFKIKEPINLVINLPNLKFLSLQGRKIGVEGAKALAASDSTSFHIEKTSVKNLVSLTALHFFKSE